VCGSSGSENAMTWYVYVNKEETKVQLLSLLL